MPKRRQRRGNRRGVVSDSSDRTRGANSIRVKSTSQFASTFTGVTYLTCSPAQGGFGSFFNNMALLYLQYKIHSIEIEAYNTGGANLMAAYSGAIVENSQTVTSMSMMQVSNYQPSQLVAKPLKLRITSKDLRGDKRRYYTWAAAATDFDIAEKFQGYIYLYHSANITTNYRITADVSFFNPVSYNLSDRSVKSWADLPFDYPMNGNTPTPIEPADNGFSQDYSAIIQGIRQLGQRPPLDLGLGDDYPESYIGDEDVKISGTAHVRTRNRGELQLRTDTPVSQSKQLRYEKKT